MHKPLHLASAANAAHALALELYRFTSRWPECEREGLALEVRRAGCALSSCLAEANERKRGRALRRAVADARGKLARLNDLVRIATDMGYRKLAASGEVDRRLSHLDIDLGILNWEAHDDADLVMIDGVVQTSGWSPDEKVAAGNGDGSSHPRRRRRRYR